MPTIPQSERHGERLAVVYYNESTQTWEQRPLSGDSVGNASVIDGITQVPRYDAIPTIGGVPAQTLLCEGAASNVIIGAIVTVGAADTVEAANRLAKGLNTRVISPGESLPVNVDTSDEDGQILKVHAAVFGTGTHSSGVIHNDGITNRNGGGVVGGVLDISATAAQMLAGDYIVEWTLPSSDNVYDGEIYLSAIFGIYALLTFGGRSHAA